MKKAVAKKAVAKKAETLRSKLEKKLEKANANVDKAFVQYKSFLGKLYIRRGNQFVNAAELCIHDDGTFEHASKALGEQTLYLCRLNTKFGNFPFYEYYAGDKVRFYARDENGCRCINCDCVGCEYLETVIDSYSKIRQGIETELATCDAKQ